MNVNRYAFPIIIDIQDVGSLEIPYEKLEEIGTKHQMDISGNFTPSELREFAEYVTEFFLDQMKIPAKNSSAEIKSVVFKALAGTKEHPGPCALLPYSGVICSPVNREREYTSCILF